MSANTLPPTSRYAGLDTSTLELPDGTVVVYLKRRFVPPPERLALAAVHVVTQGERLDNITAAHLSDPQMFWQVCDGNRAMRPDELTEEIGRRLRITLPDGVPGTPRG